MVLRLKKHAEFINRAKLIEEAERRSDPPINRLLTVMGACGEPAFVQIAMTPTPALFERVCQAPVQAPRDAPLARAQGASAVARSLDGRGRRASRGPRRSAQAAVLRRSAGDRTASRRLRADRLGASRRGRGEPTRGARNRRSVMACSGSTAVVSSVARATRCRRFARACSRRASLLGSGSCRASTTSTVPFARSSLPLAPAPPSISRPRERKRDAARCASERSRSTWSCADRTPRCRERSSRASRASWSRPSPRTCAGSAAR